MMMIESPWPALQSHHIPLTTSSPVACCTNGFVICLILNAIFTISHPLCSVLSSYLVCGRCRSPPSATRGVLTFSFQPQRRVESWVLHMNYACPDARELSNTSAIIIETIEKTIPAGSIIRQQGRKPDPGSPPGPRPPKHHTHGGTFPQMSWPCMGLAWAPVGAGVGPCVGPVWDPVWGRCGTLCGAEIGRAHV